MQRRGSARWQGTTQEGNGTLSVQSGTLRDTPYSFKARFAEGQGTNPEELIAAAHAGCFTMALSFALNNAGFTAGAIETEAQVTMEPVDGKPTITAVHLVTRAQVPDVAAPKFAEIASGAKTNCVVSRALSPAIVVTLDAALLS
jgi:osmotically inducible protein OsmC